VEELDRAPKYAPEKWEALARGIHATENTRSATLSSMGF